MNLEKEQKGTVTVLLFGMVSFFNDIGSKMILSVLPFFIMSLGGSGIIVGLVGGLYEGLANVLKVFLATGQMLKVNEKYLLFLAICFLLFLK